MRVLLNAGILHAQRTGIGTYTAELATALQKINSLDLIFFDGRQANSYLPKKSAKRSVLTNFLRNIPGAYQWRRHLEQEAFDRAAQHLQPTLYHDPSLWPLQFDGPTVMTVHDLTHINFAHTQPRARIREIERQLPAALNRASRILVDSQFIERELQRHYSVPAQKIVVAPLAPNANFEPRRESQVIATLNRFNLSYRQYFLFIGTLEPRKNLSLALRAHAALPIAVRQSFPLIIVGGNGWRTNALEKELAQASASGHVRNLGYIDHDDLTDILAGAKLFVFPSIYEGFGIPVLEAMASGVPVISSNAACLPEVGGDAARYIDPTDDTGLAALMRELIEDSSECERLINLGIERAKYFSWEKCAAITADTYRKAAATSLTVHGSRDQ